MNAPHERIPDDSPKHNGARGPSEIMAEINQARGEIDQTLSAIENRLTPGQLVDQGLDYLKSSGAREYASNLGASLKTNPLPATLCGIGLAWLMAAGNRTQESASDSSSGPGMGERMQSAKDKVSGGMQSARETMQSAKSTLTSGMQTASQQVDRAKENLDYILRENPLVLGAVGLAIGAIAASLAPRTRTEDELMGKARDELVDQAKQAATSVANSATEKGEKNKTPGRGDGTKPPSIPPSAMEAVDKTEWPYKAKP